MENSKATYYQKRGMDRQVETDIYTLLYVKQTTHKNLLYSTENSTQYSVMTYTGKEFKRVGICMTDSLCCTPETNNIVN